MSENSGGHLSGKPELARYGRVRRAGPLLFLAGVSSRQPDDSIKGASVGPTGAPEIDIVAQTEGCIENLRTALEFALIPPIVIAVDSFLFKGLDPFEGLLSLALTTLAAALMAFLVLGWVGLAARGRSIRLRAIIAIGSLVALPGVLGFGVARLLFEEAIQRGVLRLGFLGLAPMVVTVLWVVVDVVRGVREDPILSAALRA